MSIASDFITALNDMNVAAPTAETTKENISLVKSLVAELTPGETPTIFNKTYSLDNNVGKIIIHFRDDSIVSIGTDAVTFYNK